MYASTYYGYIIKKRTQKDLFDDEYVSDFLYEGIYRGYSYELHRQVDAIQMNTHNICLYKEVKKTYTDCSLKTIEFLDCALIGVCAVIRSNTVDWLTFIQHVMLSKLSCHTHF